jgi:hypothetical protein
MRRNILRHACASLGTNLLFAASLAACAFGENVKPPPLQPVNSAQPPLKIHFDAGQSLATDPECTAETKGVLMEAVVDATQRAAQRAGYLVARSAETADVTAKLTSSLNFCDPPQPSYKGTTTMTVEGGTELLVKATGGCTGHKGCPTKVYAEAVAAQLINGVTNSASVRAFAEAPRATSPSAIAAVPNPAAPRALAQAPVASGELPAPSAPTRAAFSFVPATAQPGAYALVIGVEKYRDVPSPTGARADAERFAALLRSTLGIPSDHVHVALDDRASKGDIEKSFDWVKSTVPAGSRIYFYFSGHGAPDPSTGTSFLLPYDGDPKYLDGTAIKLQTVLARLEESKAKEVLAIVDSCFSGAGGRSVLPAGTRPLVRVQEPTLTAKIALFSAASGAEVSGSGSSGGGVFTETLLRGLGAGLADTNGDGLISLPELRDWVAPRVTREASKDNRAQTPTLILPPSMGGGESFAVAWGFSSK